MQARRERKGNLETVLGEQAKRLGSDQLMAEEVSQARMREQKKGNSYVVLWLVSLQRGRRQGGEKGNNGLVVTVGRRGIGWWDGADIARQW
jgi:hypothetical protein